MGYDVAAGRLLSIYYYGRLGELGSVGINPPHMKISSYIGEGG